MLLAHAGLPPAPHDVWRAWNLDPLLIASLFGLALLHRRGRSPGRHDRGRERSFGLGLAVVGVALLSPLEAVSRALASVHMVQHLLLVLIAAPLLARSGAGSALLRGAPTVLRRLPSRVRAVAPWSRRAAAAARHPALVWGLHTAALWLWHSAVLYDAAVASEPLHVLEHLLFLGTAVMLWRVVIGHRSPPRVPAGLGVVLLFALTLQTSFLSVLLVFADSPWYAAYRTSTAAWGLSALEDQRLAGAIMWVPAGLVYVGVALALLVRWVTASDRPHPLSAVPRSR